MHDIAARHPEAERIELWFADEARIGQKGRVTQVWYQRGTRPRGVRDQRFTSVQLFGAVCPERGAAVALVLPEANTVAMNLMLAELSQALPAQTHAVLVLDRAGWHLSDALQILSNMTLVHLPSHAPELNPVEKVWQYLRDRWLSHLVLPDYRAVLDGVCRAWSSLCAEPGRLASLTRFPWLPHSVSNS